jgi:cell fate (sporulation/competence/biofilm development) regulator YlbF (YheA/YmcA/DUF963 family)
MEGRAMISINIEKAKLVQKDRLRAERNKAFEQLDRDFMLAMAKGDNTTAIAIEEQRVKLRDVTKHEALMNAMTVEQLKACTLEELIK